MELTLNEIGALCMGLVWRDFIVPEGGPENDQSYRVEGWFNDDELVSEDAPDISLSDPPTDAQIANVWRPRERAIVENSDVLISKLVEACLINQGTRLASLKDIRNAALEVLCPDEHRDELSRFLEAE